MSNQISAQYQKRSDQGEVIKNEFYKYLRYWYWFVLSLILAIVGANLYLRYTPKLYKSSAKIKILNKSKGLELPSSAFIFNRSNINLENEIEILKSYRIIEKVVDQLNLTMRFFEEGNVLTTEIDRLPFKVEKKISNDSIFIGSSYTIEVKPNAFEITPSSTNKALIFTGFDTGKVNHNLPFELDFTNINKAEDIIGKTYIVKLAPISHITKGLKGGVNINMLGKNSDLLQLNYTSQSMAKNERVLNTLVNVFNQDGINDRQDISRRTIQFIDERFIRLTQELDSIETGIKDYKQDNNFLTVESDAELGITQRTQSEKELFDLENQLIISDLLKETLEKPNTGSSLLPANIGLVNTGINDLVNNYNTVVFERDNLKTSAGENNPQVIVLNSKLEDVKTNILESIDSYSLQLSASKKQLEAKNRRYKAQVFSLPAKEKAAREILRQQAIKESLFIFLLQKREEAAINLAITEPSIKVVEYAISGGAPISPNSRSVYLLSTVLSLLVPFGILYLIFMLDTKLHGKEDVLKTSPNIPVIGEIPDLKKKKNIIFNDPNDRSALAESFRILSSNVDYILPVKDGEKGKVIYCTSTIKGEGKTYVSLNLSLALSSINKKVLLIGADLRNPQIHTHIQEDKHKPGLSNYLHDIDYDWKDALINGFDKHPNHNIILSGSIPPNPAHLLTNGRFKKLIEEAKQEYDYIIVDTAPTILVTDTMLISQLADATIYLARANYTEKNLLNFSKELSESGKLKNIAYVVNSVGASKSYGYGYNYGYNYGYGSKA
ncbi:GumC family protein [Winogradskyella flava]|uniref:GumC family protein n=1 Tax=Winogradskyella flava TaxID=1884876 RepID=UPI002491EAD8|nr:polysaccharide biosynthesis tyrosine autokinase [Winogradskyella flava]